MIISRFGIEDSKKYYPIITIKSFIGRKNRKYDYVITTLSNKNKDKFFFEKMKNDGFDVIHIKNKIISGGYYNHEFGLNLDNYYNDVTFVTPYHKEYKFVKNMFNELATNFNRK